jgi:hypothetical protein
MPRKKVDKDQPKILEIDGVPTVDGLAAMGRQYAFLDRTGRMHVTHEGHALMASASLARGKAARDSGAGDWTQPPSRTDLGITP